MIVFLALDWDIRQTHWLQRWDTLALVLQHSHTWSCCEPQDTVSLNTLIKRWVPQRQEYSKLSREERIAQGTQNSETSLRTTKSALFIGMSEPECKTNGARNEKNKSIEQTVETQVPFWGNHSIHGDISTRTRHAATLTHAISFFSCSSGCHDVP